MTEHRHEFVLFPYSAKCKCGKIIQLEEIERRLNATEALSAGMLAEMLDPENSEWGTLEFTHQEVKAMRDYIRILGRVLQKGSR